MCLPTLVVQVKFSGHERLNHYFEDLSSKRVLRLLRFRDQGLDFRVEDILRKSLG